MKGQYKDLPATQTQPAIDNGRRLKTQGHLKISPILVKLKPLPCKLYTASVEHPQDPKVTDCHLTNPLTINDLFI